MNKIAGYEVRNKPKHIVLYGPRGEELVKPSRPIGFAKPKEKK